MFKKRDFRVTNISNIPNDRAKLFEFIRIFDGHTYAIRDLNQQKIYERMGLKSESFRKMVNHGRILGILSYSSDQRYELSTKSRELLDSGYGFSDYIFSLIKQNEDVFKNASIIVLLLKLFPPTMRLKTIYTLFTLIGKDRTDYSAQASVARNLRAILSLLVMAGVIEKNFEYTSLKAKEFNNFINFEVSSVQQKFSQTVININSITQYLEDYFEKSVAKSILSCLATYEVTNYIWTKSSLYKDQGEIKNLRGEYIMTMMLNKG